MGIYAHSGNYRAGIPGGESRKTESDQAVLDGEARSRCPRAHSQLAVDGAEVPVDGAGAKEEPVGNLGAGEPFGHQPEHLYLPGCEPGRMLGRGSRRLHGRSRGRGNRGGLPFREGVLECGFHRHCPTLLPNRRPCVLSSS